MLAEDTCSELIDEIKYKHFKKFNTTKIAALEREAIVIHSKINNLKRQAEAEGVTEDLSVNFALLKAYSDRLERISKAYKFHRLLRIADSYFSKENLSGLMAPLEADFRNEFEEIAEEYLSSFKHLALNDREPPLNLFVQILALEDCGTILCGEEFLELKKDRIYFLKKSDVSHLLSKKFVKII